MMNIPLYKAIFCFSAFMLLKACAGTGEAEEKKELFAEAMYQSTRCNIAREEVKLITDLASISQYESVNPSADKHVLMLAMGSKPSAGYRISLDSEIALIENDVLLLPVSFMSPPKGAMTASVITSPCMVVSVEKGNYSSIKVNDDIIEVE